MDNGFDQKTGTISPVKTLNVIEIILMTLIIPAIPALVIGMTWLLSFGAFDFLMVMRSTPIVVITGLLAGASIVAAIANLVE